MTVVRVLVVAVAALAFAPAAFGSDKVDADATDVSLQVNARGEALVSYTRPGGRIRRVLVWGAVNALPPDPNRPQVRFRLDYSGGWKKYGRQIWRSFPNRCRPYDGPALIFLVAACKAPDGSYWAVQRFRRKAPLLGFLPRTGPQRAWALHLSHWTGPLAVVEGWTDWSWSGRFHHLFGRYTYRGRPVHGFRTTSQGARLDKYGKLVYVDTLASAYGPGWRRENAFVTHRPTGTFCYTFRARGTRNNPGHGRRYRLTIEGPGVTPDVVRYLDGLPDYNPRNSQLVAHERSMNALQDRVTLGDRLCRKH